MSNSTCFSPKAPQKGPPLFQHGNIVFQTHYVGWIVTGLFAIVATITSLWLVNKHLQWYTNKWEQRYIVRILFMVPLYALISFASYLFWNHSTPLLLIRDSYESTVLTAFFYLLLTYLSPSTDEQKAIFLKVGLSRHADREARRKGGQPRKWVFPLSFIKTKPADGLYFLQMMKWGVLQYCVIRPTTTLAAIVLNYVGWYCNDSLSPRWGHVYITVIISVSVSIAMYCLIQLYVPIAMHLAPHKPLLKLFAVKAVVFLTFWQATFLSGLSMFGVVKDTPYMTADDINTGLSAILETFEMMLFAFLHICAFSYKPYRPPYHPNLTHSPPPTRTPRLRSLGHAFDFRETFREIWAGFIYILDRMRGVEPRPDMAARRMAMMEDVFGRARLRNAGKEPGSRPEKDLGIAVEVRKDVDVDVGGERQWLGIGDDYAYGLGYVSRRENSDGLGEAIRKELDRRGVQLRDAGFDQELGDHVEPAQPHGQDRRGQRTSWWRAMYNRISQSGADPADEMFTKPSRRNSRSQHHSRDFNHTPLLYEYDDPPPPSIIHMHRSSLHSRESRNVDAVANARDGSVTDMPIAQVATHVQELTDVLGPLPGAMQHSTSRGGASNTSSMPQFDRSDSLLARVFPPGSPAMSSTELGSAPSASSQSTHNSGTQPRTAKLRLVINSSTVVIPGNDPSRALISPPVPPQVSVDHTNDGNVDTIIRPQQLSPPPVPRKSSLRRSDRSPKRHGSPHRSQSSHRRESAGHRASYPSSFHPPPMPSLPPDAIRTTPQAGDRPEDSFDAANLYMTRDRVRQMRRSPEATARVDSSAQPYPATDRASQSIQRNSPNNHSRFDVLSPQCQAEDTYLQQPTVGANSNPRLPGNSRPTYARPPIGTRSHRRISTPLEVVPQFVAIPTAAYRRAGYLSRHSMDSANIQHQLTVPAPLAPLLPSPKARPLQDTRHTFYPTHRSSHFTRSPLASDTLASSASGYNPSEQNHNVNHIMNALPSAEVRPHRTRHRDSTGVDTRTTRP